MGRNKIMKEKHTLPFDHGYMIHGAKRSPARSHNGLAMSNWTSGFNV